MSENNERDQELDQMLLSLRQRMPGAQEIHRWQQAVREARKPKKARWFELPMLGVPQFALALFLGFVVGSFAGGKIMPRAQEQKESAPAPIATFEYITTKAD